MLIFCILMVLVLGYYPSQAGIIQGFDPEENEALADRLEKFFEKRCEKNADPIHLAKTAQKLHIQKVCLAVQETFIDPFDDEHEIKRKCFKWRDEVAVCFDRFLELVQPCLEPEESYVPAFAKQAYRAYFKYLCENSRYLTSTELIETNMAKCVNRFMKHKHTNPQNQCYASAKVSNRKLKTAITKRHLCEDLNEVYSCYEHKFKDHCSDAPKAWEFEQGLLNAMRSPCKND